MKIKNLKREEVVQLMQTMSQTQIADYLGTSRASMYRWFKKLGIEAVPADKSRKARHLRDTIRLTESQRQLVLGTLLGDGCLFKYTRGSHANRGYRLVIAHSVKQKDYILHKKSVMNGGSNLYQKTSGFGSEMLSYTYQNSVELGRIAELCMRDGKKHVSKAWLQELTWEGVAYWFMDDGCTIAKNNSRSLFLCVDGFPIEEQRLIQDYFISEHNIYFRFRIEHDGHTRLALYKKAEVRKFMSSVAPYIHPSMEYKIKPYNDGPSVLQDLPRNHKMDSDT